MCICVCVNVFACASHTIECTWPTSFARPNDFDPLTGSVFELELKKVESKSANLRPTQWKMYIPFQVNRFIEITLLTVQYKYLKSCSEDFILKNLLLRTRS